MGTAYTGPGWEDVGNIQLTRSQNGRHGVVITGLFEEWLTDPDVVENLKPDVQKVFLSGGVSAFTPEFLADYGVSKDNWESWENLLE